MIFILFNKKLDINKDSVAYNAIILTLSAVLLQFLGFFYRIVLSRIGLADGMGMYQLVMPIYSVMSAFCISGITLTISRLIPAVDLKKNFRDVKKIIGYSIMIFLLLFSVTAFIVIVLNKQVAINVLGEETARFALLLILPCLLLTGLENLLKSFFHSIKKVIPPIISETIEQIVRIVAVVLLTLTLTPKTPEYFCAVVIAAMIISECFSIIILALFYALWYKKHSYIHNVKNIDDKCSKSILKSITKIVFPIAFGSAFNSILYMISTIIIPNRLMAYGFSESRAIAEFGIIIGMTLPLLMLPSCLISPLMTIIMPRIAGDFAKKNFLDIKRKTNKLIRITGLFIFPTLIFIIMFGKDIAVTLYNQPSAGNNLFILSLSAVFVFYYNIFVCVLNGIGKQKRVIINCIVTTVFELIIIFFFVASFGILGYVYGHLISSVLSTFDLYLVIKKDLKYKIPFLSYVVNPLLASLVSILCTLLLYKFTINLPTHISLISSLLLFFLLYYSSINFLGLNPIKAIKNAYKN